MSAQQCENHYVQEYNSNLILLSQQQGSLLAGTVMNGTHKGESASPVDQLDSLEVRDNPSRFSPIQFSDAPTARRWVAPVPSDLAQRLDSFDERKLLADPKSKYVENGSYAFGRRYDQHIIDALFATAKTGKTGSDSTVFDTNMVVAVGTGAAAATGMNVAKLLAALELLKGRKVDLRRESPTCIISAKQETNLINDIRVASKDYSNTMVMENGYIRRFLGINFIQMEMLGVDGNSYRRCPIYLKSGMHLGKWMEEWRSKVSQRDDLTGQPWQVYQYMMAGATRLDEDKVVEVKCAEA